MAQEIAHFGEGGALAHEIGRKAVAQNVRSHIGARRRHAAAGERLPQDDIEFRSILEWAVRRARRDE